MRREKLRLGDKVPLALPGAVLPGGLKIKVSKLRGVESEGMLCSPKELGLADDAEGLLILPKEAPVGKPLSELYPSDTIFELEITPNRPDWLSHVGIAREVAAFSGKRLRAQLPSTLPKVVNADGSDGFHSKRPSLCPILFGTTNSRGESRPKSSSGFASGWKLSEFVRSTISWTSPTM